MHAYAAMLILSRYWCRMAPRKKGAIFKFGSFLTFFLITPKIATWFWQCSPATFEGERCLYGALTNTIREMLIAASQITSTIKLRDEFSEHMRRLQEGHGADFTIRCIGGQVKCHKFILAARCAYFRRRFMNNWSNKANGESQSKWIGLFIETVQL